jgi:hypothetical protein
MGIEESKKSLETIKKLLGWDHPREKSRTSQRNAEIALLLKDPGLMESNAFTDLKSEYEKLADRAAKLDSKAKDAKQQALDITAKLRLLKKKVRLAAAEKDPTAPADNKAAKKVQEELLRSLEHEPFYREKRERAIAAKKKIESMPNTHKQVESIQGMLDAAEDMEPDYEKALAELTLYIDLSIGEHEGLRAQIEDAEQAAREFEANAGGKDFQVVLKKARGIVAKYAELAHISDGRGIALANQKIAAAVKLLDQKTPDVPKATADVQQVITDLEGKTNELIALKKDLDAMVGDVNGAVGIAVDYAPAKDIEDLVTGQRIARALFENQQYKPAKEAYDSLKTDTDKAFKKYEPAFKKWEGYNKDIEAKKAVLLEAVKVPALSGPANYLQSLIERKIGADLIPLHKFAEACKLAEDEKIIETLDELKALGKNPTDVKFKNPGMDYRVKIDKGRATLDKELEELAADIKKLGDLGGDTSPFDSAPAEFVKGFVEGTASRDKQPDLDVDLFLKVMLRDLQTLRANIAKASTTDLNSSKADKKKLDDADALEKLPQAAEAALKELAFFNLPDNHRLMAAKPSIVELRAAIAKAKADASNGLNVVVRLEKITSDCESKKLLIEADLKDLRQKASAKAKTLNGEIDKAESSNKSYKKFYAALRDDVDNALGRTGSTVFALVEKGLADLQNMTLPAPADYEKVTKALKDTETLLSNADLEAYQPEAHAILKKRVSKELKPRVVELSPQEAENEVKAFQTQINEAIARAGAQKNIREQIQEKAKKLAEDLKTLQADAPSLAKSLIARLDKIKDPDKAAVDSANVELATIDILFKRAKSSKPAADKLEKKTKSDEFEQKKQKAAFEGSMQLFTNGVRVDAETLFQQTPDKQRNNDSYQQMVDVAEKSQSFANKGNYTAANQELVKAVNLARYFIANPVDGKTASRKQLLRLNNEYKAAVSAYLKQLSDLQAAIKDAEEPDGPGKTKKINAAEAEKALKPLFSLFGAGQFDEAVANLAKPAETLAELKDHRTDKEVALSELRLAQKFLESNKVLAHVVENTISPVVLGPLRNSLRGLEGALKAS